MSSRGKFGRYNPFPFRVDAARGDLDNPPTLRARSGTGVAPVGDSGAIHPSRHWGHPPQRDSGAGHPSDSGAIHPSRRGGHPPQRDSGAVHPSDSGAIHPSATRGPSTPGDTLQPRLNCVYRPIFP